MAKTTETQIADLKKKLEDKFGSITSKKNMLKLGKHLVTDMQTRIRLGYGAPTQLGKRQSLKSLKNHSPAYKRYRKKNRSKLDSSTRPAKQNLTFTGQLVRDLRVLKATKSNFLIGHSKKKRTGETLTNRRLSGFVQLQGRPYMNVTNLEFKRLLRFYQNEIIKPILSKI